MSSTKDPSPSTGANADSDSEDDYMKMTFTDEPPSTSSSSKKIETSLQRRLRLQREGELRGRVKSKAELAAEEEARREAALSTSLFTKVTATTISPSSSKTEAAAAAAAAPQGVAAKGNKALAMMTKMGFIPGTALGAPSNSTEARTEPIKISIKDGREGIGLESERKRKLREAAERMDEQTKKAKVDEEGYRERVRREREEARLERMVVAAQKVAEGMDEDFAGEGDGEGGDEGKRIEEGNASDSGEDEGKKKKRRKKSSASRPLRSIPVVYRGLVRSREEAERERRMRYDLEQSSMLCSKQLPTYVDDELDADDKHALGKDVTTHKPWNTYVMAEDLDEEDPELDEFNALGPGERLRRLVLYMREKHNYCFWCKAKYEDAEMDGCPGLTEEDHD
ncbi:hypothetical protein B0T20DRAFT_380964 [Sordaria brevicollis]|uniref:G-patch domain-containing protein n=1 Tax=Sordaria brevicollis TaxID=83679 RepID=A0AAE0PAN9_SORBR|nr:hypothetical protein B0T20DRAFT_380964 [Sordaria brevicollis]